MGCYADIKNKIVYLWDGEKNLNKLYEDFKEVNQVYPGLSHSNQRMKKIYITPPVADIEFDASKSISFYIKCGNAQIINGKYIFDKDNFKFMINPR